MIRLRLQFQKAGRIRYTSHRDLIRIFQRCFAAARLPILYSQGYHPHPRISLGPPLRTGWDGYQECMDVFLSELPPRVEERMNPLLPDGLRVNEAVPVDEGVPKLGRDICAARYEMVLSSRDSADFVGQIDLFMRERWNHRAAADAPALVEFKKHDTGEALCYEYVCTMPSGRSITPDDMLPPDRGEFDCPPRIARRALYVERDGQFLCPISKGVVHISS